MRRRGRALGALLVLVAGLVGPPVLLLTLGGNPLPAGLSWSAWSEALLRPDDGTVLIGLVTVVGWLAWVVFALSVLLELVTVLTRSRIRIRLPGLAAPQRAAAGLLASVVALSAAPAVPAVTLGSAVAAAAPRPVAVPVVAPAVSVPATTVRAAHAAPEATPATTHEVRPGDDLWSLAVRYYGEGREWRRIAAANPDRLSGGPDRLQVGWRLVIPLPSPDPSGRDGTVLVRRGDTLSGIAERELGRADRWHQLYALNRAELDDPDELVPGTRLRLPERTGRDAAPDGPRSSTSDGKRGTGQQTPPETTARTARPLPPAGEGVPSRAAPPTPPGTGADQASPTSPPHTDRIDDETATDGAAAETLPVLPLAAVGGLLAAGLVAGLAARRRLQLQARPVGRRIVHPPPALLPAQAALARQQQPLARDSLDLVLRAVGSWCRSTAEPVPPLRLALVADDEIELVLAERRDRAPVGFRVAGTSWCLDRSEVDYLRTLPGVEEALRPWPSLVTLGRDDRGREVLADLEGLATLDVEGAEPVTRAFVTAMAVELSFSPWADELDLVLVGEDARLPAALGRHNVRRCPDPDILLDQLERRVEDQRRHLERAGAADLRLDPDTGEAWTPEVVLVGDGLGGAQERRLRALVTAEPRAPVAAVLPARGSGGGWRLRLGGAPDAPAVLQPAGLTLTPQVLPAEEAEDVLELLEQTARTDTTRAPWWSGAAVEPERPPDNVTFLGRRFGGWVPDDGDDGEDVDEGESGEEVTLVATAEELGRDGMRHPTLLLLGPVELRGAAGTPPPRAPKQCLEYCAWLLEHPGRSALGMASALAVAEGTRRSNMSRLRTWLGTSPDGAPYLPDAYSGRIVLHPAVSSDWQRLQILTAGGADRASTEALRAAVSLVRGAPLADAAPGQWHWAEELRTDMVSCLRDVGVELTRRALADGDLDLARWAAARALAAAPGDEQLLAARIRTEHLAGNPAETERLTLQLAAQARRLGVDLDPQTVTLLQEVVEGHVRARLA